MSKERKRQKARIQRKEVNRKERYKERKKIYVIRQIQRKGAENRKWLISSRGERIRVRSKEIKQEMSKESRKPQKWTKNLRISRFPFRALQFGYYNLGQQIINVAALLAHYQRVQ